LTEKFLFRGENEEGSDRRQRKSAVRCEETFRECESEEGKKVLRAKGTCADCPKEAFSAFSLSFNIVSSTRAKDDEGLKDNSERDKIFRGRAESFFVFPLDVIRLSGI
jgi:hypothetical protein